MCFQMKTRPVFTVAAVSLTAEPCHSQNAPISFQRPIIIALMPQTYSVIKCVSVVCLYSRYIYIHLNVIYSLEYKVFKEVAYGSFTNKHLLNLHRALFTHPDSYV